MVRLLSVLTLILMTVPGLSQVTRQPYLQIPTPYGITIRWQTGTGVQGKVFFGTSVSGLTDSVIEPEEERIYHEVTIHHLKPSTKYYYSVESASKGREDQYFITSPESGQAIPVRIWVISDF